ncbi:MAG: fumarylacetoacetate hydrolase family protein [Actinomycetota bacterium]
MRLLSYTHPDVSRPDAGDPDATGNSDTDPSHTFGVIDDADRTVVDLFGTSGATDLSALLRQPDWRNTVRRRVEASAGLRVGLDEVTHLRTIPRPGRIFCIGVNYGGRNAEYRDGQDAPSNPSVFVRFPSSLTGHEQDLVRPAESEQLDYEGEIVVVVGRGGRRIARTDALGHIAGFTLGNEGTIRDWVRHAKFNVTQGKNWDASGSIGPWLVTPDELTGGEALTTERLESLHLTTTVNGELRQDDTPATMAFPIDMQIEYLSTFCTLEPGDVIFTGTPTGAGARFDPPRWLVPGDVVEVTVPELGTLRNGVRDE